VTPSEAARKHCDKLVQTHSIYQYAQEFNSCMLELLEMHAADQVHCFIKRLKAAIRTHVKLLKPMMLHDAEELAIKADSAVWQNSRRYISSDGGSSGRRQTERTAHGSAASHNILPKPLC